MLGKKLRDLRLEKGCTITAIAKATGISSGSLSKYERGLQNPGKLALSRLAEFYGMLLEDLLMEKDFEEAEQDHEERKMCPWRIKQELEQKSGNMVTRFLPCLGERCMAYEDGLCSMMRRNQLPNG